MQEHRSSISATASARPSQGTHPPLALVRENSLLPWSTDAEHGWVHNLGDRFDNFADEITTLPAHVHAATVHLLELIAEYARHRGWEWGGRHSCAHWLAFHTGSDLGAAREKVRAARAMEALPDPAGAVARGELSFSKVRALTRVATPENEGDLLELARNCTTAQTERIVGTWKSHSRAISIAVAAHAVAGPSCTPASTRSTRCAVPPGHPREGWVAAPCGSPPSSPTRPWFGRFCAADPTMLPLGAQAPLRTPGTAPDSAPRILDPDALPVASSHGPRRPTAV
jgi:hypothetical protein